MGSICVRGVAIGGGRPKICAPLIGADAAELEEEARLVAEAGPDVAELRIDFFRDVGDPDKVVEALEAVRRRLPDTPLLFTFRTRREGGNADIGDEGYAELNMRACGSGLVDLVDVELFTPEGTRGRIVERARERGVLIVVSNHDFGKTPPAPTMVERLVAAAGIGDIPKIAVMPRCAEDVLALLSASVEAGRRLGDVPLIALSMGGLGAVSRFSGEVFCSALTFGSVAAASAPGQIPVEKLRTLLDIVHESML